jgi:hypothetical protein
VQRELSQVREIVRNRLRSGNVPTADWNDYVTLLDAIESVLDNLHLARPATQLHALPREELPFRTRNTPKPDAREWMVRAKSTGSRR